MDQSTTIAICVATYLRPKGLADLLESLRSLDTRGMSVRLIVADNDPNGSAESVVLATTQDFPFPATYIRVSSRGPAAIRNHLFAEAKNVQADFIASIDDDAVADKNWLQELFNAANAYAADVVTGPQYYWFDSDISSSIQRCFLPPSIDTGKPLKSISTANTLFRVASLETVEGPFDLRFNLTGGSDRALAASMVKQGYSIVWCNEAEVYEYLPRSRANLSWILQRRFLDGVIQTRIERLVRLSASSMMVHIAKSVARIGLGASRAALSVFTDRHSILNFATHSVIGIGALVAIFTKRGNVVQYDQVHGE